MNLAKDPRKVERILEAAARRDFLDAHVWIMGQPAFGLPEADRLLQLLEGHVLFFPEQVGQAIAADAHHGRGLAQRNAFHIMLT